MDLNVDDVSSTFNKTSSYSQRANLIYSRVVKTWKFISLREYILKNIVTAINYFISYFVCIYLRFDSFYAKRFYFNSLFPFFIVNLKFCLFIPEKNKSCLIDWFLIERYRVKSLRFSIYLETHVKALIFFYLFNTI